MKTNKLWAVAGASVGLGLATVKYLLSREQIVIAFTCDGKRPASLDEISSANLTITPISLLETADADRCLRELTDRLGPIHTLVDNVDNIALVRLILPYMCPEHGRVIVTPR
jgi:NAD(P)-dependent dehydrogenase (short-subunit alcohol dehydrogenase family)